MDARILYRVGPGDRFKVVQRTVPLRNWTAPDFETDVLSLTMLDGQYLVQDQSTLEARLYLRTTKPTLMEM